MHALRTALDLRPRLPAQEEARASSGSLVADLKLFAMTFLAGFIFVSILIG
jgi:hypothetical protein